MKNKIIYFLISVIIAVGLWVYVITVVSPESEKTYYNIPVVLSNESVLNDKGLMIVTEKVPTVTLRLRGNRSDLNKLKSSDITLIVDLSRINEARVHNLAYSISYPGEFASNAFEELSRSPGQITLEIVDWSTKEVPIVVDPVGDVGPDYKAYTAPEEIMLDREKVTITGPKVVVDQITQARIEVNLNNQTQTISENYRYTLCNDKNEPVDAAQIQVNAAEVNVTVKIQRIKVLELKVEIDTQGSNISEDVLHKVFSQKTIQVAGSEYALANLGDTLTLGKVTISEIINTSTFVFDMPELPEMVQNLTPTEQVTVTITFPGMSYTQWSVNAFTLINVPEGTAPKVGTTAILLTLFGPEEQIALLRQEDTAFEIEAVVDLANAVVDKPGNMTAQIRIVTPGFENVKILGNRDVYVEWEDAITAQ